MDIIKKKVFDVINSNLEKVTIKQEHIDSDLTILGMDSIVFIRIVVELEEVFEIEIPDEYLFIPEMNTVGKIINIILSII